MFICTSETFQMQIACNVTATEIIKWWNMYLCIAWTDCICNQECYEILTSWTIE